MDARSRPAGTECQSTEASKKYTHIHTHTEADPYLTECTMHTQGVRTLIKRHDTLEAKHTQGARPQALHTRGIMSTNKQNKAGSVSKIKNEIASVYSFTRTLILQKPEFVKMPVFFTSVMARLFRSIASPDHPGLTPWRLS